MTNPARTYNQSHVARHTDGKRRISIYWTWSYPWEVQRDPALMENRFSTITEVRNVLWPAYETEQYSADNFLQGIAGTLELFHVSDNEPVQDTASDPTRRLVDLNADNLQTGRRTRCPKGGP